MLFSIAAFAVAAIFAVNIGASGTAAAMGSAFGSGAIRSRFAAVGLAAVFALLGAISGGDKVVATIGKGIIPDGGMSAESTLIILVSACAVLFFANRAGIPLSTSEVAVGSLVGCGLAIGRLDWGKLAEIVGSWLVLPFLAYAVAFAAGRLLKPLESRWMARFPRLTPRVLTLLLVFAGCYEAFSAGMNNVANAVGPIIGSQLIDVQTGIATGGMFMAAGAVWMGGRVMETNGKRITSLSLMQGSIVSLSGGTLVIAASLLGFPVPLTQASTMAIIGIGSEARGAGSMFRSAIVKRILFVWIASPGSALLVTFTFTRWLMGDLPGYAVLFGAMIPASGIILLWIRSRQKKQQPI